MVKSSIEQLYELVEALDKYVCDNDVCDWEMNFIADMHDIKTDQKKYSEKQKIHIIRLWEKYCL